LRRNNDLPSIPVARLKYTHTEKERSYMNMICLLNVCEIICMKDHLLHPHTVGTHFRKYLERQDHVCSASFWETVSFFHLLDNAVHSPFFLVDEAAQSTMMVEFSIQILILQYGAARCIHTN
jgi:hypothetical protein